jgi:5'-phosphate synthase pdxT subunit
MSLLLEKYGMFEQLQDLGRRGLPIFGTCAGAILLGQGQGIPRRLELAPVEFLRNAYGTQVDSFLATLKLQPFRSPFHGVFIRAPRVLRVGTFPPRGAEGLAARKAYILGEHEGSPVLIASGRLLLSTFHPELTDDLRVHRYFLERLVAGGGLGGEAREVVDGPDADGSAEDDRERHCAEGAAAAVGAPTFLSAPRR